MKKLKKEIIEAIKYEKKSNESLTEIAEKFKIDRHTLSKYIKEDLSTYFFSEHFDCYIYLDEKELQAVNDYVNTDMTFADIKQKYNYKYERLCEKLKALGHSIERKFQCNFNRNAFEEVITEEDAYILGFLLADGYINEDRGCVIIQLHSRDEDILIKIKDYLKCDFEIKYRYHNITHNKLCYIEFSSRDFVNNLVKYGLHQAKSCKEIPYTNLSANLIKHYIRGIIDGDGHIRKNTTSMGICGSKEVLTYILNYLTAELNLTFGDRFGGVRFDKSSNIYRLEFSGKNAISIINFLYKDSKIYLNRKYELAKKYF